MNADIVISSEVDVGVTVIDGCAVMQQMVWPKVGTIGDSCNQYNCIFTTFTHLTAFPVRPFCDFPHH